MASARAWEDLTLESSNPMQGANCTCSCLENFGEVRKNRSESSLDRAEKPQARYLKPCFGGMASEVFRGFQVSACPELGFADVRSLEWEPSG